MQKLAIGLALATTALATPALARDKTWYVEADAGSAIAEKQVVNNSATATRIGTFSNKIGYDAGGIVGYDFGGFRLESEASYRRFEEKKFSTPARVYNSATPHDLGGGTEALSFFVNGLVDFGPDNGIQGFVGGGVGVARVKEAILTKTPAVSINDSATGFAWQALAGVRAPLTDHIDLGLKYRYFRGDGSKDYVGTTGISENTKLATHSLLLTIAYNFGAGAKAAPVAPPPPKPVCNKGPFIIFFDWNKADVTPESTATLDSAVAAYANCASVPVVLAGYADRSGSPKYNIALSGRRNTAVQAYLTSHGIAAASISTQAFGEEKLPVPTADGVKEIQNRRVEITFGPGSGK